MRRGRAIDSSAGRRYAIITRGDSNAESRGAGCVEPARALAAGALERVERLDPRIWTGLGLGWLTLVFAFTTFQASAVVDGTRYFWLDDDQMISMRYARNLAEGNGLVWNPGERVEGYTNPAWTLVMAAVHLLPIPDAKTAVAVKVVSWGLACALLLLTLRLLRLIRRAPGLALPAVVVAVVTCRDVLVWAVNGVETTLLTVLFLLVIVRILEESAEGRARAATYVLMGCLPLVRSDAYHLWAAAGVLAVGLAADRRRVARLLALSLVLPLSHVAVRYWYYGDLLPNTYYLRVAGVPDRLMGGLSYLKTFVQRYSPVVIIAVLGTMVSRDRRRWLLLAGAFMTGGHVLLVGADMFPQLSRYLAHLVPVALVVAAAVVVEGTRARSVAQVLLLSVMVLGVLLQAGLSGPRALDALVLANGKPEAGLVAGLLIAEHTRPDATVAVFAAGNVPYFIRRYAIDMLGKSDRTLARLPARRGAAVAHAKYDIELSLRAEPDLVVSLWRHVDGLSGSRVVELFGVDPATDFYASLIGDPEFDERYWPNPAPVEYLQRHNAVYASSSSPERSALPRWHEPDVSR